VSDLILRLWIALVARPDRSQAGQTTSEYALVMLAAAALATVAIGWATKTHAVSRLFDIVMEKVLPH
jgi:uncharacterized protein DUF4244